MRLKIGKTHDEIAARVQFYMLRWVPRLGLDSWTFFVRFRPLNKDAMAEVNAEHPEYESATLYFNAAKIRKEGVKWGELEAIVLHELLHVLVWEMMEATPKSEHAIAAEERTVQRLGRALFESEAE